MLYNNQVVLLNYRQSIQTSLFKAVELAVQHVVHGRE